MSKLKTYQQQLQDIVEKGINAAEEQQKKLAAKPFELAEKLESNVREYSVNGLRTRYYGRSENLFEHLRNMNGRFGNFAAELIARLEKDVREGADAVVETAEEVKGAVVDTAEEVKGDVVKTAEEVRSAVVETADDVKKAVSEDKPAATKAKTKKSSTSKKESTPA